MSNETIQLCPLEGCPWMNDVIESDEDSVLAASKKTLRHLIDDHPTLDGATWLEVVVRRVKIDDLVVSRAPA